MWKAIADDISTVLTENFVITQTEQLHFSDINDAYRVSDGTLALFVKINDKHYLNNFQTEAISLEHLASSTDFVVPRVITCGSTLAHSYLVLDYLPLKANKTEVTNKQWFNCGLALAILHNTNQQGEFGWIEDNYIGLNVQTNNWQRNWSVFFAEQRIGYQLQLLQENKILVGSIDELTTICQRLLCHHHPVPSLVHGDLWHGNVGFVNEKPCIFDPACYYGDREVDIAMSELFSKFPASFYQGYESISPMLKGYEQRKIIYNGYHILNHANLFAGAYIEQAKSFIKHLQKQVV